MYTYEDFKNQWPCTIVVDNPVFEDKVLVCLLNMRIENEVKCNIRTIDWHLIYKEAQNKVKICQEICPKPIVYKYAIFGCLCCTKHNCCYYKQTFTLPMHWGTS